jgi:protein-S-isoprenylcysteine O-methyltransferase Ste14
MRRPGLGTALFALVGPVVELGVLPLVLTGFETGDDLPGAWPLRALGGVLAAAGLALIAAAMVRFAREGRGTPSPLAPPVERVRGGVYRWLAHPMYVGATVGLVGEAFLLRQPILLIAAALYAATMAVLVRFVEAPLLERRFGPG